MMNGANSATRPHKDAFLLGALAGVIRWIEDLVNLLSGPLLTLGLGIALVALLTDGQLLARVPALLYVWAISQAAGVDAQLVSTWDRARIALREHRYWSLVGLVVLGGVLAYVAWVAAQVFALQESQGIPTAQALTLLGMDSSSWLVQRTALQVFLVALAGWTRYHKPAPDVAADTEAERQQLEADLLLEPLRAQKRAMQARGVRGVVAAAMGKETPAQGETPPAPSGEAPGPSTPPTKPRGTRGVRTPGKSRGKGAKVVRLRNPSVEDKARAHWQPGMSVPALQKAAGISRPSAQKYHAKFSAESAQANAV